MFELLENPKEKVNAEYVTDISAYLDAPVKACDKQTAHKLLKQFLRKGFLTFWTESVNAYLPAVSEGTMKLAEKVYPHDEALRYAKQLITLLEEKDLARSFLYGVAHNAPEYRTALACYYYIKNLPEHPFVRCYVGSTATEDVYSDTSCEICRYRHKLSDEPKLQFWYINLDMVCFYLLAAVPNHFCLNTAITYLDEYRKLPKPDCTCEDLAFFRRIIDFIENLPNNTPPSELRKALKSAGLLRMTTDQLNAFIDMLGYLNILHTEDSFGVTVEHTLLADMLPPLNMRTYFAHPVNRWTRKNGIDYAMLTQLFGDLY